MSALALKADVAFCALTTNFSPFGRPLFRHPDWFAAICASLLFRRHSWRRHVGDPITDNAQSAVDDIVHSTAPANLMLPLWLLTSALASTTSRYRMQALAATETRSFAMRVASRTDGITIGKVSRLTGVHIETIRYYERIKMLPKPPRTVGGRRTYGSTHVRLLAFIKRSRELGFSPGDVRALL